MTTLNDCRALDARNALRPLRDHFVLPEGVIYLDGNSLGVLPRSTAARVAEVITREWGQDLIRAWNSAGWFTLPQRLGDRIASLIGAGPGEVVATDSTSVNLYKVLSAALNMAAEDAPAKKVIVSERSNFPTDLYIAEGLCRERGYRLQLVEPEEITAALTQDAAVLMLTHVNYRTGAMHDMAALTSAAHAAGVLVVWDLAHSAGAVPVDLQGANADFAIGCGYKYLNGGPGAPAFVWVHPRHADRFRQPLSGWWGHAAPFEFTPDYQPAPGITRYLCGTQPILSLAALECGLEVFGAADALGGMGALRTKSLALTDLFITLVEERCAGHGLGLATPREHAERGSQVCLSRSEGAYAIVQALIARGVIGDFRAGSGDGRHPDILRFGFTPLYIGFEDVWHAVEHLKQVLETGEWQRPEFNQKHAVT
ncbi:MULTISPECIES: kynureninase [unclassified Polaromonas]|jgi:kynureninase|uniref:kynureninase n=1 Tax=unclassified Polaromonas TaxID=2638319 RepID=UPI000BC9D385|nr:MULTISPECIES: kynureninase [unclassified Polaromonas]OYY36591.1 MAG: kynureninase [Polaromonas sp. 35-63-35]OYZ18770.1 MAG: kynureninase [Polaromonas sp. 16-63-31]OYZ80960.1 MAG: kynureninase [Polaromonas sp. 24-63-21]OZA52822.1 MAG: kynureninase [Polaromonas sp. 17-63-33]OZA88325.1 MAG: kynureninase [Polaromonas sp. 39-63-25]